MDSFLLMERGCYSELSWIHVISFREAPNSIRGFYDGFIARQTRSGRHRHVDVFDAEVLESIDDGIRHRRRRGDRPCLACPL